MLQENNQSALDDKAQWVQCRQESVAAAQQQASRMPTNSAQQAELQAKAERLRGYAVAGERAELLLHLHNSDQPTPAGWKEAGNNQASRDQLKLSANHFAPGRSDFQAGVYAPDRDVMGNFFAPNLVATGSPSSSASWHNATQQANRFQSAAYNRHVQLASKVRVTSPANAADDVGMTPVASELSATDRAPCAEDGVVEAIDDSATAGLSARSRPGAERIQEINQQLEGDGELSEAERQALKDERAAILVLRHKRDLALEKACHYYAGGSREACQFERSLLYYEFQTWGDLSGQDQEIYRYYQHTATLWADGERDRITDISRQALSDIVIDTLNAPVVIGKIAGSALMGDEESQALLREMGDELKAFAANPAAHISESNREQLAYADALEQAGQRDEADLVRMRLVLEYQTTLLGAGGVAASLPKFVSKVVRPEGAEVGGSGDSVSGSGASNVNNGIRLNHQLAAEEIAGGHGFEKHVLQQGEFSGLGVRTRHHYQNHIENVLNNPSSVRYTSDGRSFHLQESTGTVVVRNPSAPDGGTAFQPQNWNKYVSQLPTRTEPY